MGNNVIKDRRPPRVYRIERDEKTGTVIIHVGIKWPAGPSWRLLSHCNLHSPTGFEVGYTGSGPADTAASILGSIMGAWIGYDQICQHRIGDAALKDELHTITRNLHTLYHVDLADRIALFDR